MFYDIKHTNWPSADIKHEILNKKIIFRTYMDVKEGSLILLEALEMGILAPNFEEYSNFEQTSTTKQIHFHRKWQQLISKPITIAVKYIKQGKIQQWLVRHYEQTVFKKEAKQGNVT